jgi:hypothetical protein
MQGGTNDKDVRGLSREFVVKSILHILDTAAEVKGWGSVTVQFQAGICRVIKEERTTVMEGGAIGVLPLGMDTESLKQN